MEKMVIVAEDELISQKMVTAVLEQIGYTVQLCSNGQEVVNLLKNGLMPHFLLLDLGMPLMSGIEVLEYLNRKGLIERIPTMIFSAKSQQEIVIQALTMGAHDYIVKPFNPDDLRDRITDLVFDANEPLMRKVIENLRMHDAQLFRSSGLQNWSAKDFDAYQTNHHNKILCVLIPKGVSPKQVAELWSMAKMADKLHVFRKCSYGWRKVWPIYAAVDMKKSS